MKACMMRYCLLRLSGKFSFIYMKIETVFFEYLWQLEDRNPNIVNVHIKKIRAKINDQAGEMIENIYGEGYRLNTVVKK